MSLNNNVQASQIRLRILPRDVAAKQTRTHIRSHRRVRQMNRVGFIHLAELIPLQQCDGDIQDSIRGATLPVRRNPFFFNAEGLHIPSAALCQPTHEHYRRRSRLSRDIFNEAPALFVP